PSLFLNPDKVMNFRDHAAYRRRVGMLDHLLHPPETQAANGLPHAAWTTDKTYHPLYFQLSGLIRLASRLFLCRYHIHFEKASTKSALPLPFRGLRPLSQRPSNAKAHQTWP